LSDTEETEAGEPPAPSDIRTVSILDEMKRSYLDYAMSVIVARALPDARGRIEAGASADSLRDVRETALSEQAVPQNRRAPSAT